MTLYEELTNFNICYYNFSMPKPFFIMRFSHAIDLWIDYKILFS